MIYKATGNLRAIHILGHSNIENTVRYLGVDVEDAPLLARVNQNLTLSGYPNPTRMAVFRAEADWKLLGCYGTKHVFYIDNKLRR